MTVPFVSVIMPTYNKAEYLRLTLTGFQMQTYTSFEIVVVDDGSTDHTREVIESFAEVLNIRAVHQKNSGRSASRNAALATAKGEIWVFNDDDRIPDQDFLQAHVACLQENPNAISIGYKKEIITIFDPMMLLLWDQKIREFVRRNPTFLEIQEEETFAVLLSVDDLKQNFAQRMEQLFYQVPVDQHMEVITEYGPDLEHFAYGWLLCTTGNLAMMAEYSNQVQFDEAFTGWGLEDNDFAFQWCLHGRETVCTLTAINYHQVHRRGPTEYDELRRNMSRFNDKYRTAEGVDHTFRQTYWCCLQDI